MTDETVDCFNCGRANPEWAQVCRSCGVALRHGEERVTPSGPLPTDQASLVSIAAVIGTIVAALLIGLFVSGLDPTEPGVGLVSPTPVASVEPSEPSEEPLPSDTPVASGASASAAPASSAPAASPSATAGLPGTMAFGSALDDSRQVSEPVETFTPPVTFAYSVTVPGGFGAEAIENEIIKLSGESETVVLPRQSVGVSPDAETFGYVIGTAGDFLGQWGPGEFEWRVYVGGEVVARGTFRFAEG